MTLRKLMLATSMIGAAAPALAIVDSSPSAVVRSPAAVPQQLDPQARQNYRAIFAAIRAEDWSAAAAGLDAMPAGLLTPFARAELYVARNSPKAEAAPMVALITANPELPQAAQIARLATTRGAEYLPGLPLETGLKRMPGAPRRQGARAGKSDAIAAAMGARIVPLIKEDRPDAAEILLSEQEAMLSPEALSEWQQRVAWSYYLTANDAAARRLAARARTVPGEWAVQADWVAGLAAYRQKDYAAAAESFSQVAARAHDSEMTAAGLFWAARADMGAGHPERVQPQLRTASRMGETFYGLMASGALGKALPAPDSDPAFMATDWAGISRRGNARVAAALVEIGEPGYADATLRHQARIGGPGDHQALLRLAARLNLPSAEIWLAQNGPAGMAMPASARYPAPAWTPQGGWRVDKSLVFAHALQESQFRTDAVSRAGARGLMQLLPSTAQLIARHRGWSAVGRLDDPQTNIEFGQCYLEELRDQAGTGGLLPKVIAAYNAGPGAVMKWNDRRRDNGDPLLFIESIPYVETRAYVATVLRNYWMYQQHAGVKPESIKAMAQGLWPRFPGLPGRSSVRIDPIGGLASAD